MLKFLRRVFFCDNGDHHKTDNCHKNAMNDIDAVYSITREASSPFEAGYRCRQALADGVIIGGLSNPYEPDTKDGEDFSNGVYSWVDRNA